MDQNSKVFKDINDANIDTDNRLQNLENREYSLIRPYTATGLFLNNQALTVDVTYTTSSIPDTLGFPAYTRGIFATFWINSQTSTSIIYFAPSGVTPDSFSQRYYWYAAGADTNMQLMTQTMILTLGNDGKINILAKTNGATANMTIFGYWL